jgi:hypothetical protein
MKKFFALGLLAGGLLAAEAQSRSRLTGPHDEATEAPANALFIDSSFAPLRTSKLDFRRESCAWLREDEAPVAESGTCYDTTQWNAAKAEDVARLKGLVDSLSSVSSKDAAAWTRFEKENPPEARRLKGNFLLAAHGTRAVAVAFSSSEGKLRPLALRSLTSKAGADVVQTQAKGEKSKTLRAPYPNGCALVNWTADELEAFADKQRLLAAQSRIATLLDRTPSLRTVNLSLGYKRSWIQEDFPKCSPEQVEKEYAVATASWRNLFKKFPDRLFVVAAGNESENFDKPERRDDDLWARLSDLPNLLLVGSMASNGTVLPSSNFGLPVSLFAKGEGIEVASPLPTLAAGHPSRLRGTSFSAPLVTGRATALWMAEPSLQAAAMKKKLIEIYNQEQLKIVFPAFEKFCRSDKTLDTCLDLVTVLISRPLLWADTHELYVKGRRDWGFKPFPMQFQKNLAVLGQTRLMPLDGEYLPGLVLKPSENPHELLITLHHEIYHFSTSIDAIDRIADNRKLKDCVTPYQLALLKDEIPAYAREAKFFETAPEWFRKKLSGKKYRSELLQKDVDAPTFYRELQAATKMDRKFLVKRLVDLGAYPVCVLELF